MKPLLKLELHVTEQIVGKQSAKRKSTIFNRYRYLQSLHSHNEERIQYDPRIFTRSQNESLVYRTRTKLKYGEKIKQNETPIIGRSLKKQSESV